MPVSYPLVMPTNRTFAQINLRARNAVAISRSPYTFETQVLKYSGEMWEASVQLPVMKRDEAAPWIAFLLGLRGRFGTFLLGDPDANVPLGTASTNPGTPTLLGNNSGDTVQIQNAGLSSGSYLLAGDYVQIGTDNNRTLHKVLQDVGTDSLGRGFMTLWPSLRRVVSAGTPVVVSSPRGLFRLTDDSSEYSVSVASRYGISFTCEEVL